MHRNALRSVLSFGPDALELPPLRVVQMPATEDTPNA